MNECVKGHNPQLHINNSNSSFERKNSLDYWTLDRVIKVVYVHTRRVCDTCTKEGSGVSHSRWLGFGSLRVLLKSKRRRAKATKKNLPTSPPFILLPLYSTTSFTVHFCSWGVTLSPRETCWDRDFHSSLGSYPPGSYSDFSYSLVRVLTLGSPIQPN